MSELSIESMLVSTGTGRGSNIWRMGGTATRVYVGLHQKELRRCSRSISGRPSSSRLLLGRKKEVELLKQFHNFRSQQGP
jgi:hypothetical protein